jgi:hypothetical protein
VNEKRRKAVVKISEALYNTQRENIETHVAKANSRGEWVIEPREGREIETRGKRRHKKRKGELFVHTLSSKTWLFRTKQEME